MKNIKLTIAYDGTNYNGWQRQQNAMSIQQRVEEACSKIFGQDITITGASRTDTGVHALGQVACLQVDTPIPPDRIPYALNTALPSDIVIVHAEERSMDFHPRFGAKKKTYEYKILNADFPVPQMRNYATFVYQKLDMIKIIESCQHCIGTYDFAAFCATGSSAKTTTRTIYDLSASKQGDIITLSVTGNGFLYNMVRIIAGTLIEIGMGKKSPEQMTDIIMSRDRTQAGRTAPPQGLTLVKIVYEEE